MSSEIRLERVVAYAAVVVPGTSIPPNVEMLLQINQHTFGLDRQTAIETVKAILFSAADAGWIDARVLEFFEVAR